MSNYRLARQNKTLSAVFLSVLILQCAVIAHSQGAAVVHHVPNEASCRGDRLTGLVTIGQGISKPRLSRVDANGFPRLMAGFAD